MTSTPKSTPRETLLAAIGRRPAGGFCFSTYNCHPFAWGPHAAEPGYRPILEAIDRAAAACLCKVSATRRGGLEPRVSQSREGSTLVTTAKLATPRGELIRVTRTPPGQPSMCVRHFVQDDADVERYLSLGRDAKSVSWDVAELLRRAREIGERGLPYLDYTDPFYEVSELFDQEDFIIRCATEAGVIEELVRASHERVLGELRSLLAALKGSGQRFLFYTAGPERATPPLLPPAAFERFVVPYQRELVALIHSAGHPVSLHCHGRIRKVLDAALECGYDVIEPLEPPPQGDIGLEELLGSVGDRAALLGYMQDQDLHRLDPEEIRDRVRRIRLTVGARPGFVCAPTCTPFQFPPSPRYVASYVAFLEEAAAAR